jgi:hypothetical protein
MRAYTPSDAGASMLVPVVTRKVRGNGTIAAWTELYVRNQDTLPTDVTVEFFTATGESKGTVTRANVPAGGMVALLTRDTEMKFLGKKFNGWARVTSSGAPLAVEVLGAQGTGKQLSAVNAVSGTNAGERVMCGDLRVDATSKPILTLLNGDATQAANVRLRVYDAQNGAQVADVTVNVNASSAYSVTAPRGFYQFLQPKFRGMLRITTEQDGAREIVALMRTHALNAKGRVTSTSAYVCR